MSEEARKKVAFEGEVDRAEAEGYLKELAEGLKAGSIWVQSGNDIVGLHPSERVTLSVEAKRKADRQRLTLELEWEPSTGDAPGEGALVISSEEPESVIVEESD